MKVTKTQSLTKPTDVQIIDVRDALASIYRGDNKETIELMRDIQRTLPTLDDETAKKEFKKRKDELKRQLPLHVWTGEFSARRNDACVEPSGLMVLDFDHVDVNYVKSELQKKDYIYACWTSPSGDGVKALVKMDTVSKNDSDHKIIYKSVYADLRPLGLDTSGKDIARGCFESYDPDIYVNKEALGFKPEDIDVMKVPRAMILSSKEGELHPKRRDAAHYAGGFVKEGLISYEDAYNELWKAVEERGTTNPQLAMKALKDGLEHGMGRKLPEEMIPQVEGREETILDKYPALSFVADSNKDTLWLKDLRDGKIPLGQETGIRELDKYFRFKEGTFNVVMGRSNVGKSTVIWFMMALANMRLGWRWIVFSQENRSAIVRKEIAQFICGQMYDKISDYELEVLMKHISEAFKIIEVKDLISAKDLLMMADELLKTGEFKGLMIDPYNALKVDNDKRQSTYDYHYETISNFKLWSEVNNCSIFLNTHTGTVGARKVHQDGEMKGYPTPPEKFDVENGVMFDNKADEFIVIHRYVQHPTMSSVTEWHQKKVKETWSGGKPTPQDEPIKLTLCRRGNFNSFYDEFDSSPMKEAYDKFRKQHHIPEYKEKPKPLAEKSVFSMTPNTENPF
jgi:hypothetical protein